MRFPLNFIWVSYPFINDAPNPKDNHYGDDFGWSSKIYGCNQPIYACWDGVVIYYEFQKTGGYVLHIRHTTGKYAGLVSEYAHLQKGSIKVKVGDYVSMGQQIANMGNTGIASGYHLHFGLYRGTYIDYKVNRWVNPLDYLEYYPDQIVSQETIDKYHVKKHEDEPEPPVIDWTVGDYRLLVAKTIRTSCSLTPSNRVKVKDCTPATKQVLTSRKPNDIAMIKVGTVITATRIYTDETTRVWGRYGNCWIVLCNRDGTPQAEKV